MVLQNHNTIAARSIATANLQRNNNILNNSGNNNNNNSNNYSATGYNNNNSTITTTTTTTTTTTITATATATATTSTSTMGNHQRPVIDLLVAMVAVPILILCALQLEKNLHDMANSPESRWLVFALGIGMLIISIIIIGYVTHRMGVCIWAGPIDEAGMRSNGSSMPHINSQNDILRFVDSLPPSYESVIKFDIPPPPYDCLVIDIENPKDGERESLGKPLTTIDAAVHM